MLPGITAILAAAALAPVLVTSVWMPPDGAVTWIWAAIGISMLAAFAIVLLFTLLIRERRALERALQQQDLLERKLTSIGRALEDAKIQFDLLSIDDQLAAQPASGSPAGRAPANAPPAPATRAEGP